MKDHGPWKIKSSREIYSDPFVDVRGDDVIRPDGKDGHHVVVFLKPGVCVIPMDEDSNLYLTSEFHYGIGRDSLEGASGGIETGEGQLETAKRELQEELGILAEEWTDLGFVDPFTTCVVSPTQVFLAEDLSFTEANPEGTELIECVKLPLADAIEKVMNSEITHGPSCVLILKIARILEERSKLQTK